MLHSTSTDDRRNSLNENIRPREYSDMASTSGLDKTPLFRWTTSSNSFQCSSAPSPQLSQGFTDSENVEIPEVRPTDLVNQNVEFVEYDIQQFVLSICWKGGKIGAAYYNIHSHELHAVADIVESACDHSILRGLFFQVQPSTLILNIKQYGERMAVINRLVRKESEAETGESDCLNDEEQNDSMSVDDPDGERNNNSSRSNCRLHCVSGSFYNLEAAKRKLMSLRLRNHPDDMTETERVLYLRSVFPLDYPVAVQATGALLRVLENWKRGKDVECMMDVDEGGFFTVSAIHLHRLEDIVWMDQSAFIGLKIFSEESHPSSVKKGQNSSAKEGLSLFGITNKCYSNPGYLYLRKMFLRPTKNITTLNERYSVIRFCKQPANLEVMHSIIGCLRNIHNVKILLAKIAIMQGTIYQWRKLLTTTTHLMALSDICKTLPQDISLFQQLGHCLKSGHLNHITSVIHRLIDFQESKRMGRCVIKHGVDEDLDHLKRNYSRMSQIYDTAASQEIKDLPSFIDQGLIEFIPQLGHCLCLRSWLPANEVLTESATANFAQLTGLELKFFTHDNAYFKSKGCHELDTEFGDFEAEIVKHEMSILLSAANAVVKRSEDLVQGIELAAYLDALVSLTALSTEFDMVEPKLFSGESAQLHIEAGRHPFMQLVVDSFHPTDTSLGGDNNGSQRINIITGPNASGKSVYIKQTAILVFLAQIGCFVPAKRFFLSPVDKIFMISHSSETLSSSLSQFAVELGQMSMALREANSRSLVIVDEFGQGTSTMDGTAVFFSCLEYWMTKGNSSPLVLVATHLHGAAAYLSKSQFAPNCRFMSMSWLIQNNELIFLFKPVENSLGKSFPFSVAISTGMDESIIKRSQKIDTIIAESGNLNSLTMLRDNQNEQQSRLNKNSFFAIPPDNIDDLKQFIRRQASDNGNPSPQTQGRH